MQRFILYVLSLYLVIQMPIAVAKELHSKTDNNIVVTTPLHFANQLNVESALLQSTESINVYLPDSFAEASDEHRYPVIFANDEHGSQFFLTLVGVVSHLSKLDRMPESIVVSLNSGGHIPEVYTNGMWGRDKLDKYGAPQKYLDHIKQELMPYLQQHYRAANYSSIIGVSGSSLFPLYALTHAPETFDNYILLAAHDIIGMSFEPNSNMIESVKNRFASQSIKPTSLYFAVADDDAYSEPRFSQHIQQLDDSISTLKKHGLQITIDVIANERHYDAFIKTVLGAFEQQFPEKNWAPKYRDLITQPGNALANIDAYYQQLSKDSGITVLPRADRWNSVNCLRWIAGKLLTDGRIEEAKQVAERWAEYRPKSAQALQKLALALQANKEFTRAIEVQRQAVQLAVKNDLPDLAEYQQQLSDLQRLTLTK